ncbi:MAG: preprotein translocase subunit SecE [Halanaerobiaceae bacterium]|jgi:preprotein translocase subunit SecE|nr:preprotein translocase subunit SecE [Halanaerobiaceae bacterium]
MAKDLNIFGKIARFFRQLKAELKKVNWPARNELSKNTVIVVVTIIALTVFIWLVDLLFGTLLSPLIM